MTHDSFSVSVYMPNCTFSAELQRDGIGEADIEMDTEMTKSGIFPPDTTARVSAVMDRVVDVANLLIAGEMTQEDAISEIAFGFIYTYAREQGIDGLATLCGLVGCLTENGVYLNPCADAATYQSCVDGMREAMSEAGSEMMDVTPPKPTIH